jgi:thiamine biosynthesis lipoprotein
MVRTEQIMGMPVTVEVVDEAVAKKAIKRTFDYFREVDGRYSTYKKDSEISRINSGLPQSEWSHEMRHVMELCTETKRATKGFFDVRHDNRLDLSGLVKGWAIQQAALKLRVDGIRDFRVDAGGDAQVSGQNSHGQLWEIGIRNPFDRQEIVKVLQMRDEGIATSGTAVRGQHIYNPHAPHKPITDIVSLSVIGPDIYEADRFATAAFAMGRQGIAFIESRSGLEGYMIDADKKATFTSGFGRYLNR